MKPVPVWIAFCSAAILGHPWDKGRGRQQHEQQRAGSLAQPHHGAARRPRLGGTGSGGPAGAAPTSLPQCRECAKALGPALASQRDIAPTNFCAGAATPTLRPSGRPTALVSPWWGAWGPPKLTRELTSSPQPKRRTRRGWRRHAWLSGACEELLEGARRGRAPEFQQPDRAAVLRVGGKVWPCTAVPLLITTIRSFEAAARAAVTAGKLQANPGRPPPGAQGFGGFESGRRGCSAWQPWPQMMQASLNKCGAARGMFACYKRGKPVRAAHGRQSMGANAQRHSGAQNCRHSEEGG